jgi:hypothetical protein
MPNDLRDTDDLIHAYLRGRLSEQEAAHLELELETRQDRWRDFERVFRAREGLACLDDRGELTRLMAGVPWYRRTSTLAAAAALASVTVGGKLLIDLTAGGRDPVLSAARSKDQGLATRVLLVRRRGETPSFPRPESGLLDIRIRPEYAASHYDLEMSLPSGTAERRVLAVRDIAIDEDGQVAVFLKARDLPLGEYQVRIAPTGGDESQASEFDFRLNEGGRAH